MKKQPVQKFPWYTRLLDRILKRHRNWKIITATSEIYWDSNAKKHEIKFETMGAFSTVKLSPAFTPSKKPASEINQQPTAPDNVELLRAS